MSRMRTRNVRKARQLHLELTHDKREQEEADVVGIKALSSETLFYAIREKRL